MKEPLKLSAGDWVQVIFAGRTVDAVILLASDNGVSLMLYFDALLGGYLGQMPVLWEDGEYRDLLLKQPVEIKTIGRRRKESHANQR